MKRNKKAMDYAISTLIGMVIAVVLLAILIFFMTGGFQKFKEKMGIYSTTTNVDQIVQNCNTLAFNEAKYEYCCVNKTVRATNASLDMTCLTASDQSWGKSINKLNCADAC